MSIKRIKNIIKSNPITKSNKFGICYKRVLNFLPKLLSKSKNKSVTFVKKFKNYNLYIPQTYEQFINLGIDTKWNTHTNIKYFNEYRSTGNLYVLISKDSSKDKYRLLKERNLIDNQYNKPKDEFRCYYEEREFIGKPDNTLKDNYWFHFENKLFIDKQNYTINIVDFLSLNPDIEEYFKPQMDEKLKFLKFENYEIKTFEEFKDSVFYALDGIILMEWCEKINCFYLHYSKIYTLFRRIYNCNSSVAEKTLKDNVEKTFNFKNFYPRFITINTTERWKSLSK